MTEKQREALVAFYAMRVKEKSIPIDKIPSSLKEDVVKTIKEDK